MHLTTAVLLCFCASLAAATAVAQGHAERFHDFTVAVDYRHASFLEDETFIFDGSTYSGSEFAPDHLYLIRHEYASPNRDGRIPVDTVAVYLTAEQRDILFDLTRQLFELDTIVNIGPNIPPPPLLNHGMHPVVSFDLNYRGDRFTRHIRNPNDDLFRRLDSFLRDTIGN